MKEILRMNIVEMLDDTSCFNQKCKFGNLVEGHAVYCHSEHPRAPRKCRHTWYFGEKEAEKLKLRDEDCPYYEPNDQEM
jgi:hypothetical protein